MTTRTAHWLKVVAMMIDPVIWPPAANLWLEEFAAEERDHPPAEPPRKDVNVENRL